MDLSNKLYLAHGVLELEGDWDARSPEESRMWPKGLNLVAGDSG